MTTEAWAEITQEDYEHSLTMIEYQQMSADEARKYGATIRLYLEQEKRKAEIRGTLEGMKLRDASLHLIVFIALKAEEISEGKACELTGLGRISVREKVQELPELACLKEARKEAFEAGRERVFAHERPEHGWEYPSYSDYEARRGGE